MLSTGGEGLKHLDFIEMGLSASSHVPFSQALLSANVY